MHAGEKSLKPQKDQSELSHFIAGHNKVGHFKENTIKLAFIIFKFTMSDINEKIPWHARK